ncbi:MAG: hypothetical protein ABIP71_02270 [Verrucomicrobiota bacterium]
MKEKLAVIARHKTFGVNALAPHLSKKYTLTMKLLDHPNGL